MVWSKQASLPTVSQHGPVTMNYEKQNGFGNDRPLSSSTSSPKWITRGHPLPRVAASPVPNGSSSPRRESGIDVADGGGRENGSAKENVGTPVKAVNTKLSSNITPRSGSRKARAESASTTPNGTPEGTPINSRPVSSIERVSENMRASSGLGVRSPTQERSSRSGSVISDGLGSTSSSRPPLMERNNSAARVTSPETSAKFFHANDVQLAVLSKPAPERSVVYGKVHGYMSAGENAATGRTSTNNSPTPDEHRNKFFYANDPVESKSPPLRLPNGTASNRPPLHTIYSAQTAPSPHRAPSPLKEEFIARKPSISKPSPRRHTRLVSNGSSEIALPEVLSHGQSDLSRRSSLNSPARPQSSTHGRSSSVQSIGPSARRKVSLTPLDIGPSQPGSSLVGASGALSHCINPPTSSTREHMGPLSPSLPQSPNKPKSKLDHMNDMAANARRERKVLDLEISNSSLLAINRTLEREMRKQNAEIRRFRRLSRCGRLSVAPSSRSASGRKSMLSETDTNLDSGDLLSPSDSENDEDNEPDDLFSTFSANSTSSRPSSPTTRAARTRFADPKRIPLDLSAHRTLLLESQKLNQSIKRCLSQTESLITSGRHALEYRVHAPGIANLGPKVLTPDEIEDDEAPERGQGLLSPSIGLGVTNPWERSLVQMGSLDGGLETPDYSTWGSPTEVQTPWLDLRTQKDIALLGNPLSSQEYLDSEDFRRTLDAIENPDATQDAPGYDTSLDEVDKERDKNHPPTVASEIVSEDDADAGTKDNSMRPPPSRSKDTSTIPGNTPGTRSSLSQNLGSYLQSFSIFGTGQPEA